MLFIRSLYILPLVLFFQCLANATETTTGVSSSFDRNEGTPVTETGTTTMATRNMSLAERTAPFGRVHVADEAYRVLAGKNKELRDRLTEVEAQIEEVRNQMEELRMQIAKREEKITALRQKAVQGLEEKSGAGPVESAGDETTELAGDSPYKVIDGHIDENTLAGWKTFRGIGACTTCHGPAGQGGVGKDLMISVKQNDEEFFNKTVTDGKKSTQMIPYKNNKAVMDNLHNIYAYLMARSDGVIGTENLIRYPLGKKE